MGHTLNGKANDGYQKCCQGLARLGFFVLAFDPMGQGERAYYPGPDGATRLDSADAEHTYPGKQMLLVGDTATRFQVWDAVRSLDYLASRPEVDPKRLASTGQSGGGTLTMLLACVDDRLAAAAVCSGNTENVACAGFDSPGATDDAEQDLLASAPLGFDRWDLLYPIAPKPLLILVSAKDYFGTYSPTYISDGREEFRKLQRIYDVLQPRNDLKWIESPLPHGLSYFPRLTVYNFMRQCFYGRDTVVTAEPEVRPEADRDLWAGPTGNVIRDFGSKTPFSMTKERAAGIRTPARPRHLETLLRLEPPRQAAAHVLSSIPSGSINVQAIEVSSAPEVTVPAWMFVPPKRAGRTILLLDERGRNLHWREGGLCEQIASRGRAVCAADLRGIGDLRPEVGRGNPAYTIHHDGEESYAWASLILGRPLLGQRVADILALTAALHDYGPIHLAASGELTVPALFAAALDPRIESLYLAGGLISYRSLAETETYKAPLATFLVDVLAHTDLPQLAASIAPRRVVLSGAVDAAGNRASAAAVQALYASPNVKIEPEYHWTAEALTL
jgi:dienelactone hydrolase